MGQAADFFVSYTGADRAWAEWIAWQLEAEGYQVIVQAWDFTAGRDWIHEMQQATISAERVVIVLSATYLQSAQGEAELRVWYAQDPSGERGLVLPVRVDKVDPPGLLKSRIYVDLVDKDAASARAALLAAARGARGKPTKEPEFPGGPRMLDAIDAPRFPEEELDNLKHLRHNPYHANLRDSNLRVFLCHSSSDKPAIRSLYRRLLEDDVRPWLDEIDILPGQDWDLEIRKAIRECHIVLVCLSKASITKVGYLQKEIRQVLDVADEQPEGTTFLIPVRLEDCKVPDRLRRWQWVDLFESHGYERLMLALARRAQRLR